MNSFSFLILHLDSSEEKENGFSRIDCTFFSVDGSIDDGIVNNHEAIDATDCLEVSL